MIDLQKIVLGHYDCKHIHGSLESPCSLTSGNPKPNNVGCFSICALNVLLKEGESEILVNVIKPSSSLLCIKEIFLLHSIIH